MGRPRLILTAAAIFVEVFFIYDYLEWSAVRIVESIWSPTPPVQEMYESEDEVLRAQRELRSLAASVEEEAVGMTEMDQRVMAARLRQKTEEYVKLKEEYLEAFSVRAAEISAYHDLVRDKKRWVHILLFIGVLLATLAVGIGRAGMRSLLVCYRGEQGHAS